MIRISFTPPQTPEWAAWLDECRTAQTELNADIATGRDSHAKSSIYGRLKEPIYIEKDGMFSGKCAFCETFIYSAQHGDIEHFRPKGAVKDVSNNPILLSNGEQHRGYYWLAYDYMNLLPSCQLCNQPSTGRSNGLRIGKWNAFPLADEARRAQQPGDEIHEEPLLINPTADDPAVHLGLHPLTGVMFPLNESLRGEACIDIFGLNLRGLPGRRIDKYREIHNALLHRFTKQLLGADHDFENAKLQKVRAGVDDYALAGRHAIEAGRQLIDDIRAELDDTRIGI